MKPIFASAQAARVRVLIGLWMFACAPSAETRSAGAPLLPEPAGYLADGRAWYRVEQPQVAQSDAPSVFDVASATETIARGLTAFVPQEWGYWAVLANGSLVRVQNGIRSKIAEEVVGTPSVVGEQVVFARSAGAPGETDLWRYDSKSVAPLVVTPGPDHDPLLLPDGRVVFVSGRTGVASLWLWEAGEQRQLTNVGAVPGVLSGRVPVPESPMRFENESVRYEDGSGQHWRVALKTGAAEVTP